MKTKVKAFTLNEMVIVMIISTIVVGLAFTVLSLVQKHMWSIQQNFSLNTEFNRLEQAFWIDINNYGTIKYDEIENELKLNTPLDSTIYKFKQGYVLKDKDTFNISLEQKLFFFNGNEVKSGIVDAFRLQLPKKYKDQHLFIFKINDATQFVK